MTDRLGRCAPGPRILRPVRPYGSARSSRRSYPALVLRDEPQLAPRDLIGLIGFKRSNAMPCKTRSAAQIGDVRRPASGAVCRHVAGVVGDTAGAGWCAGGARRALLAEKAGDG